VVELHGALAEVKCLGCGKTQGRDQLQSRLEALNPGLSSAPAELAPDGDAELAAELLAGFSVPSCEACGGVLKPNVVFFGEGVPRETVQDAYAMVDAAGALLVLGSSLAVFSGFRFVKRAHESGRPIGVMNVGETRADALATVRVEGRIGELLPRLVDALVGA
jgi:NAD-dependent SIR2 family protein deacetylase